MNASHASTKIDYETYNRCYHLKISDGTIETYMGQFNSSSCYTLMNRFYNSVHRSITCKYDRVKLYMSNDNRIYILCMILLKPMCVS